MIGQENSPSLPSNGIKISEPTVAWLLAFSRASGRLHACICFESHRLVLKFPSYWLFLIITVPWFTKLMHSKVRGPYWLCEARQQHSDVEENFPAYWFFLKSLDSLSSICKFRRDKFSPWHMSMIKKWHGNSQWKLTIKKKKSWRLSLNEAALFISNKWLTTTSFLTNSV